MSIPSDDNQPITKLSVESVESEINPVLPCNEENILNSQTTNTQFFVQELPSKAHIEFVVHKIIGNFIDTLKNEDAWMTALLKYISKEHQLRSGQRCNTYECLFRIPCYLSQNFLDIPLYLQRIRSAPKRQVRRRRSIDSEEEMTSTLPTALPPDFSTETVSSSSTTEAQVNAISDDSEHNNSSTLVLDVTSQSSEVDISTDSELLTTAVPESTQEMTTEEVGREQTLPTKNAEKDEDTLRYPNNSELNAEKKKAPITTCKGRFADYCYNSINCIYVSVLKSAACQ